MMVEQSLTLVLVLVWLFMRMLARSEQEELRRERLEEAQVAARTAERPRRRRLHGPNYGH